jgi:hypothetical protein
VGNSILNAYEVARSSEKVNDVSGHVREVVAQVLVRAGPVHIGAVDEDTAVGTNAPADEVPGRRPDDVFLPRLKGNPSLVLLTSTVLREEAGEMN